MKRDAIFSHYNSYRYRFSKIWDSNKKTVLLIGLNPSNGTDKKDDPTLTKLTKIVEHLDGEIYGGFYVGNLFAFITPKPHELIQSKNPIGDDNDCHLIDMALKCEKTICMWGNEGVLNRRDKDDVGLFEKQNIPLYCFGFTEDKNPMHSRHPMSQKPTQYKTEQFNLSK
jgi:hypothetical protein